MVDETDRSNAQTVEAYQTTQPGGSGTPTQETIVPTTSQDGGGPIVLPPAGYHYGEVIGRGGMGEVVAAHDLRIGRDVAVKRMRDGRSDSVAVTRFLREARIQARLDHPAIVPVHELGTDEQGRPYFTMKRLAGETLAQQLARGGRVQPLLRAFADVCLAVELAHTRGVVHRDLKPANIMLGDYGEVYVLDWGVARVVGDPDLGPSGDAANTLDEGTETGSILGTPGYMAPEQIRGERITGATDVYALGAILFEILAADSLHPRGHAAVTMTLARPQDSPATRKPDRQIAPELDEACVAALAEDPAQRPSARELADRVQRYLDGDRDTERRHQRAMEHVEESRTLAAKADGRARAIYHAGRALALDPDFAEASELMVELLVTPPVEDPPELRASLVKDRLEIARKRALGGRNALLSVFAFLGFLPFLHVASVPWLVAFWVALALMAAVIWVWSKTGDTQIAVAFVGTVVLSIIWSRIVGPFMLTPVLICGAMMAFSAHPWMTDRPLRALGFAAVAVLAPSVLEQLGLLPTSVAVRDGEIATFSTMYDVRGQVELAALTVANLGFVLVVALFAYSLNRSTRLAREHVQRQMWALRQLLPSGTRPWETQR